MDIKPDSDCAFEATGATTKDVVGKMFDHIKKDHMDDVKGMSDGALRTMIESKVHE